LPYLGRERLETKKVLYDTTTYIDQLQGRFPPYAYAELRTAELWHSTVTEAELVAPCGLLDPRHPGTALTIAQIVSSIERRRAGRTISPDREMWLEASVLSSTLARLQQYGREQRWRIFLDSLLFATARKFGLTLVTRNVKDFDFLQQIDPAGRVMFYECV
jgi:predicted nucleic acid-binding protein